jgi:hypothetical protein
MNDLKADEHESLFVISHEGDWLFTGGFRNGSPESCMAVDVGNPAEYASIPEPLRTASWPVETPCVTLQASSLCLLTTPEQVRALAYWLLDASESLDAAIQERAGRE